MVESSLEFENSPESRWKWPVILAALVLLTCALRYFQPAWQAEQLFLKQADAFLNGRLNIDARDIDTAVFQGQYFVPYPLTPAILYLPFVAIFGTSLLIPYLLCYAAIALIAVLFFSISKHFRADDSSATWIATGFTLGTGLWLCVQFSYSATYNSHLFSVLFVLAGIHEALKRGRSWLVGICIGAACTSRPFTIAALIVVISILWSRREFQTGRSRLICLLKLALGILPFGAMTLILNDLRFGNPFDIGYSHISGSETPFGALFNLRYLPRNLYTLFFRGPNLDKLLDPRNASGAVGFDYGIVGSDMGTGLLFSSPFLLYAFLAPRHESPARASWAALLLNLAPISLYVAIGMLQLNCPRYSLDFLPELFFLTVLGLRTRKFRAPLLRPLVAYAIALNVIFLTPILAWILEGYFWVLSQLQG